MSKNKRKTKKAIKLLDKKVLPKNEQIGQIGQKNDTSSKNYYKKPDNEQIKQALIEAKGNLFVASRTLGCSRSSLYLWLKDFPELIEAKEEGLEQLKDIAENKLEEIIVSIPSSDPSKQQVQALISFLKMKAKDRGYTEKTEMNITNTEPIEIIYERTEATD